MGPTGPAGAAGPAGPAGPPGSGLLWVDADGLVLGPALTHSNGYYVDADGYIWDAARITGEVSSAEFYMILEGLFTGPNCTGTEFVAGSGPGIPMEVGGVLRGVPVDAPTGNWTAGSQREDGVCLTESPWWGLVTCDRYTACYATADVNSWPVLTVPGPFAAPLHAEWR